MELIEYILELLKELSKPKNPIIKFGYIEDYDINKFSVISRDGLLLLGLDSTATQSVSISLAKDKSRELRLFFLYPNSINDNSLEVIKWFENILDELVTNSDLKQYARNIDYSYDVELIKTSNTNITGNIIITTKISVLERRNK